MRMLFFFLDGVGLGVDDPRINPFASAEMSYLRSLLDGRKLVASDAPIDTKRATLRPLDACLGVSGLPQSATGQATLLTGVNVPKALGYHYGPKPNPAVAEHLRNGNLFKRLRNLGASTSLINAYPPRYFDAIHTGKRLYSAIPLAITHAGVALKTIDDLLVGKALSADFTGAGWREHLGYPDFPLLQPGEAGARMARLAIENDLTFFEFWLTDYAGHKQNMAEAVSLLATLDQVIAGLAGSWQDAEGLILVTSDHGNLEDLSTRRHTVNPVPALVIGSPDLRREFVRNLDDLGGVAPAILSLLTSSR